MVRGLNLGGPMRVFSLFVRLFVFTSILVLTGIPAYGQGAPWYTIPLPVPGGFVDAVTGNVHLEIPLTSISERNGDPLIVKGMFDSTYYTYNNGFGTVGPGWQVFTGNTHVGTGWFNDTTQDCTSAGYGSYPSGTVTSYYFSFVDSHSTSHPLGNLHFTKRVNCSDPTTGRSLTGEDIPSTSGSDVDGTGYSFQVNSYTLFQVSAPDGTIVYDTLGPYSTKHPIDTNGNYTGLGVGSQPDMLGRSPFQFQPNVFVHLCPPSSSTISVLASDGSNNAYTFTCTSYSVSQVFFGTTYTATESFLTNIALPDGTQYSFTYDTGSSDNHNGALLSVTLPAGGVVSFTYPSAFSSTVTYAGGTWTITRAFNNTTRQTTSTVMSPLRYDSVSRTNISDKAVFTTVPNFLYLQTAQYYSGSSTVLRTVTTAYDTTGGLYLPTTITTTLNDSGQSSSISYQYYNQMRDFPSQKQETDFAGTVVRTTKTTYNTSFMKPTSVNVYAGSGTGQPIARTLYTYDEYSANYCKNNVPMLTNIAGATGHDDTNHGLSFTARGNATTIQRLISGNTYATTHRCYDTLGNVTQEVDAKGNPTSYDYNENWADSACIPSGTLTHAFPTTTTDALGFRRKIKYFSCTSLIQASADENDIRANRPGATYTYDFFKRVLTRSDSGGGSTTNSYSPSIPPSSSSSTAITPGVSLGRAAFEDVYGRTTQTQLTTDPDCPSAPVKTNTTYDAFSRGTLVSNPYCTTSDSTYGSTSSAYDALGRVTQVTAQDGVSTTTTSYFGNCSTTTDPAGKSRKSCSDALGRLTQVFEDPSGLNYETDYQYDVLNNLLCVAQKGTNSGTFTNCASTPTSWRPRSFTYDSLSRLTKAINPESGTINYAFDANGNLTSKTSPAPNQTGSATVTVAYCYDALNRLLSKAYTTSASCPQSSPVATYLYDQSSYNGLTIANGIGRRTGMTDAAGAEAWSYDPMGRVADDLRTTSGISKRFAYAYNLDGSLGTLTYPSSYAGDGWPTHNTPIGYVQGGAGRPLSGPNVSAAHYAPNGAICSYTWNWNATYWHNYSFNNRFQPVQIHVTNNQAPATAPTPCVPPTPGSVKANLDLTYSFVDANSHNNGNIALETINDNWYTDTSRSQTFTYDSLNRLATAQTTFPYAISPGHCWAETYTYDSWGNLYQFGANSNTQSAYIGCSQESGLSTSANTKNQLTSYSYDSAGNVTSIPSVATYAYNTENQLTSTAGVTYTYDGDGKRVSKSSGTLYFYGAGSDSLMETDSSGNFRAYYYFNGIRVARQDTHPTYKSQVHYVQDHLGNMRFVWDGSTGQWDVSDYYPFGGQRVLASGTAGSSYKFTGKERDPESGLDNFGARYDSSSMGRFMTPDWASRADAVPYAEFSDPQSLNLYAYVRNNPVNKTDPDGHCDVGGEHHWGWCIWHTLGFYQTRDDRVNDARNFFNNNSISINGHAVDPSKMTNQQVLDAFKVFNDVWRENGGAQNPGLALAALLPGAGLKYESNPKHGDAARGVVSAEPTNAQQALENSIQIKNTSTARVAVDPSTGEYVMFREHGPGAYHGYATKNFNDLPNEAKAALQDAGLVSKSGKFR